jgi:hypothetical protein
MDSVKAQWRKYFSRMMGAVELPQKGDFVHQIVMKKS